MMMAFESPTRRSPENKDAQKKSSFLAGLAKNLRTGIFGVMTGLAAYEGVHLLKPHVKSAIENNKQRETEKTIKEQLGDREAQEKLDRIKAKEKALEEVFGPYAHLSGMLKSEYVAPVPFNPEKMLDADFHPITTQEGQMERGDVRGLLNSYPAGWVYGEVSKIEYRNEKMALGDQYGMPGAEALATCSEAFENRSHIVFYAPANNHAKSAIHGALSHELGHANDWERDNEMEIEERLDLLKAIGERIHAPDRFQSGYVEKISNADKYLENYSKATEYWAEITAQYFTDPGQLNIKDAQLVQRHIQKTDPHFSLDRAMKLRDSVLASSANQPLS